MIVMYHPGDTIAAIASASGGGARGDRAASAARNARAIAQAVFHPANGVPIGNRAAALAPARAASTATRPARPVRLPADLFFWPGVAVTRANRSPNCTPWAAEPLVGRGAVGPCVAAGARPAEPGEFTLRAFLAGRIDLAQAEAVLGVIDAASRDDLDVALEQLAGGLTGPLREVRERLLDLLAHLEAGLDFVEEDIEFITFAQLAEQLAGAIEQVSSVETQMADRTLAVDNARVVLYGRPNVGKSSLFNALCGADAGLVADLAGTTRDYVTARSTSAVAAAN